MYGTDDVRKKTQGLLLTTPTIHMYLHSRVSEEGSYLVNGIKIRATIGDQDGHLWDPEGEGTRTIASRRVENTMSEGKGKGCGGPATWRDRREREREREPCSKVC